MSMDVADHMTSDELTEIFRKVVWDKSMKVDAFFSAYLIDIRWVMERDHIHICVGSIYDVLSKETLCDLAKWVLKYMTTKKKEIDHDLFERIKKEIQPNRRRYERFMKYNLTLNSSLLLERVLELMKNGMISYSDIEGVSLYWLGNKSKCIGCCSRFFGDIGITTELMVGKTPYYVLDYIIYCNVNKITGRNWRQLAHKYPKKDQAEQWLKKNIGFEPDKIYSIPTLEIIR